ncbi:MAG: MbnP family copper-binding protein [Paraglaciecola sp.]|uniref:MbnP family copper-binding protein n=1 Tax=Paraglaciecola sp. TaxID=1920173 RepID=UPI003297ECA1
MTPIKHRMKITYYYMKLVNTLPFRPDISKFLFSHGQIKVFSLFVISCLAVLVSSCSKLDGAHSIAFEVWHNGSPLDCNEFAHHQQNWSIEQLAFFISNVQLSAKGADIKPQLSTTPWQSDGVVLVQPYLPGCDIESTAKAQTELGKQASDEALKTNDYLQFAAPVDLDSAQHLSFSLAVPFGLNHQNPLLQPSPLNLPSMFWSWRSGHKFLRLDMQSPNNNWVFHMGSVGCSAASTMRSPQEECVQPNRVRFDLDKQNNGAKLVLHLDRLIADTPLQRDGSCLFHSKQQSCDVLMSNLTTQNVFEWH